MLSIEDQNRIAKAADHSLTGCLVKPLLLIGGGVFAAGTYALLGGIIGETASMVLGGGVFVASLLFGAHLIDRRRENKQGADRRES